MRLSSLLACFVTFLLPWHATKVLCGDEASTPNVVVIFIDDMGYADIGPFGAKEVSTPHLDRMAREGRKFTDFIVPTAVCSASRAALLTGCIHERVSIRGALGPQAKIGISSAETTLAEICKSKGYATACFGKWHLGHHPAFLPLRHGFDVYYGLPYSNDMWPFHPEDVAARKANTAKKPNYPDLPMFEGETIVDAEVTAEDQKKMTREYTRRAVQFIQSNSKKPFFLYLPHNMVHVPLYSSEEFEGKGNGPFADAVREVDWSVGEILKTLDDLRLSENTLVVFTSDNGPWLSYGSHAGSAGPLREGKGTSWEGGIRVPAIMRWPGKIAAGTQTDELMSTIDLLPTVAGLIGAKLPDHKIDGRDKSQLLLSRETSEPSQANKSDRTIPIYYADGQLQALRSDRWKMVFPHTYRSLGGRKGKSDGTPIAYKNEAVLEVALYDLDADIGETTNVISTNPEVAQWMQSEADAWRSDLGDSLKKIQGSGVRPVGKLE
ncbi:sulfatase family protein [Pirellulaceae bacterium SH501]